VSGTYGPVFDKQRDGPRLRHQHEKILHFMISQSGWTTLSEIRDALSYPESSISAQLRHLRKPKFGRYVVEKRRRHNGGLWEYRVLPPKEPEALSLFDHPRPAA
jgi:hypothetical protein